MIRRAVIEDVGAIMALEKSCLRHPWEEAAIRNLIESDRQMALVDERDGKVVGYIGFSWVEDESEIGNICVDNNYRRRKIATGLLEETEREVAFAGANNLYLEVEDCNVAAMSLYKKCGFIKSMSRKDYYGPGRNAELYCKNLKEFNCEIST